MLRLNCLYCGQLLCLNYRLTGLLLMFTVVLTSPLLVFLTVLLVFLTVVLSAVVLQRACHPPLPMLSTPKHCMLLMYCAATFHSSHSSQLIIPHLHIPRAPPHTPHAPLSSHRSPHAPPHAP